MMEPKKEQEPKPIEAGMTLYEYLTGRYVQQPEINTRKVDKVGRKYFYLEGSDIPFDKETLQYKSKDYIQYNRQLYKSEQEIKDMLEHEALSQKLSKFLEWGFRSKITLAQLRQITQIINLD